MKLRSILGLCALLAAAGPARADESPGGIAFDQIDRANVGEVAAFGRERFDRDRRAIAAEPRPTGEPSTSLDAPVAGMDMNVLGSGTLHRYSFLGNAARVDDPLAGRATIYRPGVPEVDVLDVQRKRYRRLTGETARQALASRVAAGLGGAADRGMDANTITLDVRIATRRLPPQQFADRRLPGVAFDATIVPVHHTGACVVVKSIETHVVKYYDPELAERAGTDAHPELSETQRFLSNVATPGCRTEYQHRLRLPRSEPGAGRLYVYRIFFQRISGDVKGEHGPVSIPVSRLSERGNVTHLSARDASLFTIPADYTAAGDAR